MHRKRLHIWSEILLILLSVSLFIGEALCQDTASIFRYPSASHLDVMLQCFVTMEGDVATYSYRLKSGPRSKQAVDNFFVDVETRIGTINSPRSWRGARSGTRHAIMWFSRDSTADIRPGRQLSGFEFLSVGLPTVGTYYARGFVPIPEFPYGQTPDSVIGNDVFQNAVKGPTVTSKSPPAPFVPIDFLDTLLSYTRQSDELGWLGKGRDNDCDDDERPSDGILKNIELRLQKAKRELTKGDSVEARKELEKLVQKVERIWKRSQEEERKHKGDRWERKENVIMTSEAYALLKYNTEYVIDRLPDKSKHGRDDDKDKKPKK
jgi:hypothetical protein